MPNTHALKADPEKLAPRSIETAIRDDLSTKAVFVGGPRQVGKTMMAQRLLHIFANAQAKPGVYLNWDHRAHREDIIANRMPTEAALLVLDEIHKYAHWRDMVKGLYDTHFGQLPLLITGSARLDYYRKGGDSMLGRYHYHRLHPFSLNELDVKHRHDVKTLLRFGGFPEPFLAQNARHHRRWQRARRERILYDDLRDLERVREISLLELLLEHLPACVGSPLSVRSLARKLQVAPKSVESWLGIFERLYLVYRISPYGSPRIRAVKKEQKLYFWDWSELTQSGACFENLVASQLLKYCHQQEDQEGWTMELRYVRDTDGRELDFVVLQEGKPLFAVECKQGEREASKHAAYFRERTPIPRFYQVHLGEKDYGHAARDIRVLPFTRFCTELGMP